MNVGELFAGIGGFGLGLERAGFDIAWQCEIDEYRRAVLRKHWPDVPCYSDIRELRDPPTVDVICGGFPCTDISYAGRGAGIHGQQSGLWSEMLRLVRDIRPRYVIVENVAGLTRRGMGHVLGGLAACGFDAEWDCLPASAFGAPHRRDRVWIVAYPNKLGRLGRSRQLRAIGRTEPSNGSKDTDSSAVESRRFGGRASQTSSAGWWAAESSILRVAHGVPNRLDRLGALGDSLVPQIAQWLGERILAYESTAPRATREEPQP